MNINSLFFVSSSVLLFCKFLIKLTLLVPLNYPYFFPTWDGIGMGKVGVVHFVNDSKSTILYMSRNKTKTKGKETKKDKQNEGHPIRK